MNLLATHIYTSFDKSDFLYNILKRNQKARLSLKLFIKKKKVLANVKYQFKYLKS